MQTDATYSPSRDGKNSHLLVLRVVQHRSKNPARKRRRPHWTRVTRLPDTHSASPCARTILHVNTTPEFVILELHTRREHTGWTLLHALRTTRPGSMHDSQVKPSRLHPLCSACSNGRSSSGTCGAQRVVYAPTPHGPLVQTILQATRAHRIAARHVATRSSRDSHLHVPHGKGAARMNWFEQDCLIKQHHNAAAWIASRAPQRRPRDTLAARLMNVFSRWGSHTRATRASRLT